MELSGFLGLIDKHGFTLVVAAVMFLAMILRERKLGGRLDSVAAEALKREDKISGEYKADRDEFRKCQKDVIMKATETHALLIASNDRTTRAVERSIAVLERIESSSQIAAAKSAEVANVIERRKTPIPLRET